MSFVVWVGSDAETRRMWVPGSTKRLMLVTRMALAVACLVGSMSPLVASPRKITGQPIRDIALNVRGELQGVVVDRRGRGLSTREVVVRRGHRVVARTHTTRTGHFMMTRLASGLYVVSSGTGRQLVRVWSASSAPPRTPRRLVLVDEPRIVRGQSPASSAGSKDPLGRLLLSGEVMAIPLVCSDNQERPVSP